MIKAACRPYVPNARTNVLKLKTEFIPNLGDTVNLCIVGARYARRVGSGIGEETGLVCELAMAAPTAAEWRPHRVPPGRLVSSCGSSTRRRCHTRKPAVSAA